MLLPRPKPPFAATNSVVDKLIDINRSPYESSVVPNSIRYKDFSAYKSKRESETTLNIPMLRKEAQHDLQVFERRKLRQKLEN